MVINKLAARVTGMHLIWLLALCGLAACAPSDNNEEAKTGAAGFYDGRVIKWIIPYSPGGGYDEYGRMLAPYLEKHTGARVDILNLTGAGGMRGANELFNAPNDGLTIGLINGSALVTNELAGIRGADYKIAEFEFLGRIVADRRVLVVTKSTGFESFEELLQAGNQVKIGATGLGGSTYVDAVIVNEAFNADFDIIHGFDSSSVVKQSMLRGNIAGTWGSWGSALDAVDQGTDIVILQSGRERLADLSDVPTAFEMAEKTLDPERANTILIAWELLHAVGRPVALPPKVNPEKVRFLREAFDKALHDPEMLAIAAKTLRPIDYVSGEEVQQIVIDATSIPDDIEQLFVRAIKGEL